MSQENKDEGLVTRRRGAFDIMADILSNIPEEGIRKTALAYRSRTDYRVFLRYLQLMIREGLVRYDEEQGKVYVTDRGRWFLQQWKSIRGLMKEALGINP